MRDIRIDLFVSTQESYCRPSIIKKEHCNMLCIVKNCSLLFHGCSSGGPEGAASLVQLIDAKIADYTNNKEKSVGNE